MTNYQIEERAKQKKHWVDQAIALAMQSKWDEAIGLNQTILEVYPSDVDALNRLGRALTELGRFGEAREAYRRAVGLDPLNSIAQKNLSRLSALHDEVAPRPARGKVDPRFFLAETGKTGITSLVRTARRDVLARMAVGDQVYLYPEGRGLYVRNARDEPLGQVEPKLSQRLIDLMHLGNLYAAAIMSLDGASVRVIIRESYQDPSQSGRVSFPTRGDAVGVRPYTKDSLLRHDADEEEDEGLEELGSGFDADDGEEAAEPAEFEEERAND